MPIISQGGRGSMGCLECRINSLQEKILEEANKDLEDLEPESILELCKNLDTLLKEYISADYGNLD